MSIQQDYSPNLDADAVYDFLMTGGLRFLGPAPTRPDYVLDGTLPSKDTEAVNLHLFWAKRDWFDLTETDDRTGHTTHVATLGFIVTIEQPVKMVTQSRLLLREGLAQSLKDKIIDGFRQYVVDATSDPVEYARLKLGADYDPKTFAVMCSFSLEKTGAATTHDGEEDQAIGFLKAHYRNPGRTLHVLRKERTDFLGRIPSRAALDPHDIIRAPGERDEDIVKRTAGLDAPQGCDIAEKHLKDYFFTAGTLANYPEFRTVSVDRNFDVGCGIHIVLRLPVLQTQISAIDLIAFVRGPDAYWFETAATDCLKIAAFSAAVVGVALLDLPSALETFDSVVNACLQYKFGTVIDCVTPGLALARRVVQPWQ